MLKKIISPLIIIIAIIIVTIMTAKGIINFPIPDIWVGFISAILLVIFAKLTLSLAKSGRKNEVTVEEE